MLLSFFCQPTSAHGSAYSLLKLYKQNYVLCTFSTLLVVCVLCGWSRLTSTRKAAFQTSGTRDVTWAGPELGSRVSHGCQGGTCAVKCVPIKVLLCTIVQIRNLHQ